MTSPQVATANHARPEELPQLLARLSEASWVRRRAATQALAELGDAAVPHLVRVLTHQRDHEGRIAAAVDALSASVGTVEPSLWALVHYDNPAVVADVAQILGRRHVAGSTPFLIELLAHPDDNVAVAAIEALSALQSSDAVDALIETSRGQHFFRVFAALDALGRTPDPRVVAPLTQALRQRHYEAEAARSLGRTGNRAAVNPLCQLLTSPRQRLVRIAASALAELDERHQQAYGQAVVTEAFKARRDLLSRYAESLLHALPGADGAEQAAICWLLGLTGAPRAREALLQLLQGSREVGRAAAQALRAIGCAQQELNDLVRTGDTTQRVLLLPIANSLSLDALLPCLTDPSADVRAMACDKLARCGNLQAVGPLFELLEDRNPRVALAAVAALQALGGSDTRQQAMRSVRHATPTVRRASLQILAYLGHDASLPMFVAALQDEDARVRDSAIQGLAYFDADGARALLYELANDPVARTRAQAMRALGHAPTAAASIDCLTRGLQDSDVWVRYFACQSLGKLQAHGAAQAVARLIDDAAGQVRVGAIEALAKLGGDVALAALCTACDDATDPDLQRAALIGLSLTRRHDFLPRLLDAAKAAIPATRLVALSALSKFESRDVIEALCTGADDADEAVRSAAIGLLATHSSADATVALIQRLSKDVGDGDYATLRSVLSQPTAGRVAGILQALETSNEPLAHQLAATLVRLQGPDAAHSLARALHMQSAAARRAAVTALAVVDSSQAREALRDVTVSGDSDVQNIARFALEQCPGNE